ncbi:MAG: NAD-dependent epimerase/dehydratase family protein [Bacteroidetes bacterium]|nr:NAD-dependent epimerase/dehydratase family protein [Bacteroidota bacterium]MCH8525102.1 NAD-dependent epimerase/dehydratase family protein [Balneolales bacterium]
MSQTVMITGGTGYIGAWLTKMLLEAGHTVRLTVRDAGRTEKIAPLQQIAEQCKGSLELFEADLLSEGSFDEAARGADVIMHVASPFKLKVNDPWADLIDPAVKGTRNVLEAANKSGSVKKVVLTSSIVAIAGDNLETVEKGLSEVEESQFNTSSTPKSSPYPYSKVMAEKEAWKIHDAQSDWKLVVINPSFVMGPTLENIPTESESITFMKNLISGQFATGAPDLTFGFVDVRDVAKAHMLAMDNSDVAGRFLLVERTATLLEVSDHLRDSFGDQYKLPTKTAPKFLLYLIGWMFGVKPSFVRRNVGIPLKVNASRSRDILKLTYTPLPQTLTDMVNQIENAR